MSFQGGWVATQRKEYYKYQAGIFSMIINAKRIWRLEKAGFQWAEIHEDALSSVWLASFCKNLVDELGSSRLAPVLAKNMA